MPQLTEEQQITKIADYLKRNYGEKLVNCDVQQDDTDEEGTGRLVTECTVEVGGARSLWRKTFTFDKGEIVNMSWKRLG